MVLYRPGFVAGSASTAATYPLEALRTHISLGRPGGYAAIARDIVKERVSATACPHAVQPALQYVVGLGVVTVRPGCQRHEALLDPTLSLCPITCRACGGCIRALAHA